MRGRIVVLTIFLATIVGFESVAVAGTSRCPSKPFSGSITRSPDSATGQPEVDLGNSDIERALAFDFGSARNTTAYLATYVLEADDLGPTLEAPQGETLVSIFLRPKAGDLKPGKRIKIPRDTLTVIVDAGGGAQATTAGARGKARVLEFSDDEVCFTIDYRDDFQRVKGRIRATIG